MEMSSAGSQLIRWRMRSTLLYYRKHHGAEAWLAKHLELLLYRLSGLRNRFSSDPHRVERVQRNRNLVKLMHQAWHDTSGGRTSPQRPWKFE